MNEFYQRNYWGYSLPNYLSASHNAHPNYAGYLDDKKTLTVENMNEIFDMMDEDKKVSYDKDYIEELYLRYMATGKSQEEHIEKSEKIHEKTGGWCRTVTRQLSAGNCLMKFPRCGKLSKRSGRNGKYAANSAERTIRTSSKAGCFAKSAEKSWFAIGKGMVHCIFTVNSAMFPSQRKTSGTASIRNCTSGWKNIRI